MIHYVIATRDSASQAFGLPFFVPAVGLAVRAFTDEVNREGSEKDLARHPDDFELYQLGVFNDATGQFDADSPKLLARGKDVAVRKGE